eukprot:m51a1_g10096 hypothetical protein (1017) ;mRNA; r:59709-65883
MSSRLGNAAARRTYELEVRQMRGPGMVRSGPELWLGVGCPMWSTFAAAISAPTDEEGTHPGHHLELRLTDSTGLVCTAGMPYEEVGAEGDGRQSFWLYEGAETDEPDHGQQPPRGALWGSLSCEVQMGSDDLTRRTAEYILLVGVGRNRRGTFLRGPRNDVELMRMVVQGEHWRTATVDDLVDEDATREAIARHLRMMGLKAQRGDVLLFYFSGLGTTDSRPQGCPDLNIPAAPTACLCPYDVLPEAGAAWANPNVVTAVDVAQWLGPALQKGATVILILDCGFSGPEAAVLDPQAPAPTQYGEARRHRFLRLPTSVQLAAGNEAQINSFSRLVNMLNAQNKAAGGRPSDLIARSLDSDPHDSISVGSVLDTLHVGALQAGMSSAQGEASRRWVDIARGAHAFGAGIVEAAKKVSATRDVALDRAALQALESMTQEQWAVVARQAIELEPRGMCEVVDSVAGGLDVNPARRHLLMRSLSDYAIVGKLLYAELAKNLDNVHAFAAVRSVVDAVERVLRGTAGIDQEECMQELKALDEGRSWGERTSKGLRWQAGQRLVVDTRATGVTQPMYSRRAGALLFPLLRCSDGGAAGAVPTSRSMEAVAHTAGHAVLDALRPKWAEGIEERPEGGVLHEAFADLVGLLVGTGTAAVSGAVAAQTRCDVRAARVAGRQAAGMAEAVGLSGMRSARSTLTARDVWWTQTGLPRQRADGRRWSSREVSAMVTSAVWAAIASELPRRCRRSRAEGKEGRTGPTEDPTEVLCQLAKQALTALVTACMRPEFEDVAPTLKCEGSQDGFHCALRCELERRFLLSPQWKQPYPRLAKGSIEHTSATVSGFLLLAGSKDERTAQTSQPSVNQQQTIPMDQKQKFMGMAAPRSNAASDAVVGGPARRMCECIAVVAGQAGRTVECPVSRQLWATLRTGAQHALDDTEDEAGAWEALVETWGAVEREAAGKVFGERRMWRAIVVEAAEEATAEWIRESVRKLVLSLEYVVGCCNESPSLALWRHVLVAYSNTN